MRVMNLESLEWLTLAASTIQSAHDQVHESAGLRILPVGLAIHRVLTLT